MYIYVYLKYRNIFYIDRCTPHDVLHEPHLDEILAGHDVHDAVPSQKWLRAPALPRVGGEWWGKPHHLWEITWDNMG